MLFSNSDYLSLIHILFGLQGPSQNPQKIPNFFPLWFSAAVVLKLILKIFMLNSKDKIRAVLTVMEEQNSDSYLLAANLFHSVASEAPL